MSDSDGGIEIANFDLKGWPGLVVVVLLVVGGGWYWWDGTRPKPAPPEVHEPLKMWIAANYASDATKNIPTGAGLAMTDREKAQVEIAMRNMVSPEDVTLKSVQIRGDHEDEAVLRAEIEIKGKPAPDGKNVHYYEAEWNSFEREWRVMTEVSEFRWNSAGW